MDATLPICIHYLCREEKAEMNLFSKIKCSSIIVTFNCKRSSKPKEAQI